LEVKLRAGIINRSPALRSLLSVLHPRVDHTRKTCKRVLLALRPLQGLGGMAELLFAQEAFVEEGSPGLFFI